MAEYKPLEYKDIPKEKFAVSADGEITSIHPDATVWVDVIDSGKRIAHMNVKHIPFVIPLARLIAVMFVPTPENIHHSHFWIAHKDGDYANLHASNLKWMVPGNIDYYERKQLLDFVHTHRYLKPLDLVKQYHDEYGITVGKQVIQNIYGGVGGNVEIFGYTYDQLCPIYQANRLSEQTVRQLCQIIVICNGNARAIHKLLRDRRIDVKPDTVDRILYKLTYSDISDEYFRYYGRNQFEAVK